jgi:hypothetical protein
VDFTGFERAGAMDDPHMVVRIYGHADGLAEDPVVRERLGPHRIDFKPGRGNGCGLDGGLLVEGDGREFQRG